MNEARQTLDRLLADYRLAESQVNAESKALVDAESLITHAIEAQQFIQNVAERVQRLAHERVAGVVTRCLESVFGEGSFEFKIDFQQKRVRTEARLLFVRNGKEEDLDASCGGAIDVASFALRLACLVLSKPKKRLFLCLDEPMKNVNGEEYQERVGEMIMTLAKELGVQFLIVTDDNWLKIGKVVTWQARED